MFQSNKFFLIFIFLAFPFSVNSQSYFGDQYLLMARDFKNQSETREKKFEAQVAENIEGIKYIGKKYSDFYIEQMAACQVSPKTSKSLSRENLVLLNSFRQTYSDSETIADMGIRNIQNKVSLSKSSVDRACPASDGDFNGYIECVTRIERYNYQVQLELEAKMTKLYFYELLSGTISKLNQCIDEKGSFNGMNLSGANSLMNSIRDELNKQYQKISKVSIGLM
jgi:hypothetical protein